LASSQQSAGLRKGELIEMKTDGDKARLIFMCPSRSLIGFRQELTQMTRGTVVLHHLFHSFIPHKGPIENVRKGVLLSNTNGTTTTYALESLEQRGTMFVGPGTTVYMGMIIGENSKKGDMDVNPVKAKALTNMRTLLKDENVRLTPPRILTLEEAITYIAGTAIPPASTPLQRSSMHPKRSFFPHRVISCMCMCVTSTTEDELVEVTPSALRMRKEILDTATRETLARRAKKSG
jgi:GTP-binding protein